jgi:hypothetical protein
MNQNRTFVAAVGLIALFNAAATAQTSPAGPGVGGSAATVTVPTGSLQRAQNAWLGRTLIGAPVFNDNRQRIATINELLINDDGMVDKVVLSVAQSRQLVAVAFNQLRFVPSGSAGMPIGRGGWRRLNQMSTITTFGVMLPGATRETLTGMETFRFVPSP